MTIDHDLFWVISGPRTPPCPFRYNKLIFCDNFFIVCGLFISFMCSSASDEHQPARETILLWERSYVGEGKGVCGVEEWYKTRHLMEYFFVRPDFEFEVILNFI